jgi:DNA-binding GntR family transcriptional regulator
VAEGTATLATARERVAAVLRDEILDGRLGPGVSLRTREVVERLGVSNSPLREALFELAAEGLVEISPNRGAVVAPLTRDGGEDLIRIAELLWGAGLGWMVPELDTASREGLHRLQTDFALAMRSGDPHNAVADAENFERILLGASWSTELVRSLGALQPRLNRMRRMLASAETLDVLSQFQLAVLEAAGTKDIVAARTALDAYWTGLRGDIATSRRLGP